MIRIIAWLVSLPRIRNWLIARAKRTPFSHIVDEEGNVYMKRYWLFNRKRKRGWLPAIRIHHIQMPDDDRCLHDHPFGFRSFIIYGWYTEIDLMGDVHHHLQGTTYFSPAHRFHRITRVSRGGVFTMVICYGKSQPWGFLAWTTREQEVDADIRHPLKIRHQHYDSGMTLDRSEENVGA